MNKSIVRHELRAMKWMSLLSILASLALALIFGMYLNNIYRNIFYNEIYHNEALILDNFRALTRMILVVFLGLSIIQVFVQFRPEKNQETARFLKSLPVKREEFFKIKLITGIVNISLAFLVLAIGLILVRNNNMFWIKDVHNISYATEAFTQADSVINLLKEIGLIYLIVLTLYSFLFMIQYTFSNVIGAIVIGALVWLAPIFIINASIYTLDRLGIVSIYSMPMVNKLLSFSEWLLPLLYPFDYAYAVPNTYPEVIRTIESLGTKYIVSLTFILANIGIAYKLNKGSKIENENMIIPFKSSQKIFKIGVSICSGLLVAMALGNVFGGEVVLQIYKVVYVMLIVLGGSIGYLISGKINKIGNV